MMGLAESPGHKRSDRGSFPARQQAPTVAAAMADPVAAKSPTGFFRFLPQGTIPFNNVRLTVQNDAQQRAVDFQVGATSPVCDKSAKRLGRLRGINVAVRASRDQSPRSRSVAQSESCRLRRGPTNLPAQLPMRILSFGASIICRGCGGHRPVKTFPTV